jgi:twitching motility protein PilI
MAEILNRPAPSLRHNRTRLREFQAELAERLRVARSTPSSQSRLALRVAHGGAAGNYLVDLPEAGEILAMPEITAVPLTRPWYRGLANVRGGLVSVIDLGMYLDGMPTELDKDSRVLSFSPELKFNAGILVTRMLGLRGTSQLSEIADDAADASAEKPAWIGRTLIDQDGVKWREMYLGILAAEERFLQIGVW